jgi:hypothetical protein
MICVLQRIAALGGSQWGSKMAIEYPPFGTRQTSPPSPKDVGCRESEAGVVRHHAPAR